MRVRTALLLAAAAWLFSPQAAGADVLLSISDGQVTLKATNATLREILTEWARVGQTKVVNAEKISTPPMTLEFNNEPEERALKTLLRAAGGYIAAPRSTQLANASRYDRILVMPPGPAPTRAAAAPPASFPQPAFAQPTFVQPPQVADDQDGDPPPPSQVMPNLPNPRGPVFNTYPPPVNQAPESAAPSAPVGVARPGMIVPAPAPQPGQPVPGQSGITILPDERLNPQPR